MILKKLKAVVLTSVCTALMITFMQFKAYAATYTVQSGDSLFKIGTLFNTSASVIQTDNKLGSSVIYPGQKLYVSAPLYTVQSGDSLYKIAVKYGISLDMLRKANNLYTNTIYIGQKITIPQGKLIIPSSVIPYTASELDLLARLITAEADGQPYNAMVAVGGVIINRVKNPAYPKTIESVIYQVDHGYYQFTPVLNGYINRPATDLAKKAALEALKGSDPSNGALYYFDDSTTNTWLWSKPIKARIGNMVFVQ